MRRLAVILLIFAFSLPVSAQWRENGKPVPDTAWSKSDGDFGAMFAFTDKPDELYAAWEKSGPGVTWSQ